MAVFSGFKQAVRRLACGIVWACACAQCAQAADVTLVAAGAACRYQVPSSGADGTSWTGVAFDDSSWDEGASGIGYDTAPTYVPLFGATVPVGTVGFYARFPFTVSAGSVFESLTLRLKYEDGFIAYLNGVEVARSNAPAAAVYNSDATALRGDDLAQVFADFDVSAYLPLVVEGTNVLAIHALNDSSGSSDLLMLPELKASALGPITSVVVNEFMALNDSTRKNSLGKYEDWVEIYNPFATNVNLSGWYLTDNASRLTKWQFPQHAAAVVPARGYLLVWADDKSYSVTNNELHTSFALSGGGEYLGLVRPDGVTVAHAYAPTFPQQYADISYGLGEFGEKRYFGTPTPGAVNAFSGPSNEVNGVKFTPKRGVYTNAMPQVVVSATDTGSEIRYTADCEVPTAASALYTAPFDLTQTAVFRAAAYKSGFAPSAIDTHSYISADTVLRQGNAPAGYPSTWAGYAADYEMNPAVVAANGAAITNALKALPSISVVTSISNLFHAVTGIYTHPTSTGTAWERRASAEWVDADNDSRFQVDCGLEIQGGAFRGFNLSMKKSFSFQFRGVYGEGRLQEELFPKGAATSFDDLVLRAGANDAWNKWTTNPYKKQYIVDEFLRERQRAMGGLAPYGCFAHLYLNGLYWGLYNVTEKVSSEFGAAYCGGSEDTWDVLSQGSPVTVLDGNIAAWAAMTNLLYAGVVDNAAYQRVQGNAPDGTRNPAYPVYLDVENYIDYLVLQYWSANNDWPHNNWRAFRDRIDSVSTGFKFSTWDAEAGLGVWGDLGTDMTGDTRGVAIPQSRLIANAEYRLRFADRVQKHLFNGGALSPEVTVPRYLEMAAQVEPALIAESARWGDMDGSATRTVEQWRTQRDYVTGSFLPLRGANVLQHFRNRGLFPSVNAPVFARFGGAFSNALSLTVSASAPVYYTLDGSDPRQFGTGAAVGVLYTNGVALSRTARVKARARTAGGEWSALTEAVFTREEPSGLRLTELMYHPRRPVVVAGEIDPDGEDEFIELCNTGSAPLGLAGLHFTEGVTFDFSQGAVDLLQPGEYVLVVRNLQAFTNRYPTVARQRIAGVFAYPATSLDDAGEKVELRDALDRKVLSFTYNNSWLVATDGAGHSLVPDAGMAQSDGELDYRGHWRASVNIGGSPGAAEPEAPAASLVLNEILAHTDYDVPPYDSNDGIEVYNTTGQPVTFGPGWYLSDDPNVLDKWAIPATDTVPAYGWRYFDEVHDFHVGLTNGFGLNKAGDQVLLSYLPDGGVGRVVDAVRVAGEENGVSKARYPDGSAYWYNAVPTPGASNRLVAADIRIDEVMYHPLPTAAHPENNENDEYVELFNPTDAAVTLMDVAGGAGAWRLSGGVDYVFPSGTVLPAGDRLTVVSFNPLTDTEALAAFLDAYGLTNGQIRLLGPFSGQLNNKTDTVRLERPVAPDTAGDEASWHAVDQVSYYDAAPWPVAADGGGSALVRRRLQASGDDPDAWLPSLSATPGQPSAKVAISVPAAEAGYLTPSQIAVAAVLADEFVVGPVQRVVFTVDGVDAATAVTAPYAASVALGAREGVSQIRARLTDAEGESVSAAVAFMTYTNVPAFSAGLNQAINLTVTDHVALRAVVEGLAGAAHPVSLLWTCPGDPSVVIVNPEQAGAAAYFSQPGQYELVLTMTYGQLVTNRTLTVTVAETNTLNPVPYREGFEGFELDVTMAGVHGWYSADPAFALIATNRFGPGAGGSPLRGAREKGLFFTGSVTNMLSETAALTNVCVDMLIGFMNGDESRPEIDADVQIAFCVNERQRLMVWHGQPGSTNRWTELTGLVLPSNDFARLTFMADYSGSDPATRGFRLWVDRQPVTQPQAWFASAASGSAFLSSVELLGEGQLDELVVDTYNSMLYRRITASAGAHGRVEPSGEVYVPVGATTNFTLTADAFYQVGTVRVDGVEAGSQTVYTFEDVWDEHDLAAEFAARLTVAGVPELWLNALNPSWTDNFEAHALTDSDGDGVSNGAEFVAGTDATNAASLFQLDLSVSNGWPVISFPTVPFEGGRYGMGGVRRYALEQAADLSGGGWSEVAGVQGVIGVGQTVIHTNAVETPARFFRGRVWLEP